MDDVALWAVIVGVLLVLMALASTVLRRLPLSTAMLYLGVGIAVSPLGIDLLHIAPLRHAPLLERLAEGVVLLSLFTAGLKLSAGFLDKSWMLPVRLALTSMVLTVGLIAAAAWFLLKLPLGACVLLGAILAPTDPVLASDVQLHRPGDQDKLRFALTGEGGLNDGTAFPFVMLGLGLLGLHDLGGGWRWLAVDVLWATSAGLATGWVLGTAIGTLVLYLRRVHKEAVGLDDFLALGLIALAYGVALWIAAYGFLAVFAAGVAMRRLEHQQGSGSASTTKVERAMVHPDRSAADSLAVHREHAPAFMTQAMLGFNEQAERMGELAIVVVIGALLWAVPWGLAPWWFVALLLLGIRPLAVALGLVGSAASRGQRWLTAWFGIRGVGSLYYLMFAVNHGIERELAQKLTALTLTVVVTSIVVHGVSVTPLMAGYERRRKARGPR